MDGKLDKETMPYFISHPQHGYHNVYTPEDLLAHEKNGWVLVSGPTQQIPAEPAQTEPTQPVEPVVLDIYARYEKAFGKKPHHRMLPKTIEAALKGKG